jgi:hypothetical protein
MTDISTSTNLMQHLHPLQEFDHCAKPDDFIEVSLWHNAEGFNVDLSSNGDQSFKLTWGQFKALKKLIKELDND